MSYGGESNAKKIARLMFWESVFMKYSAGDRKDIAALVLAGPEGADLRVIEHMGDGECSMGKMVAVDTDPRSLALSEMLHPGPQHLEGPIEELCRDKRLRKRFSVIFLDYCGTLSDRLIDHFVRVILFVAKDNAFVAIGCMYGRERKDVSSRIKGYSLQLERENASVVKAMSDQGGADQALLKEIFKKERSASLRAMFLNGEVEKRLRSRKVVCGIPLRVSYRSGRRNEYGRSVGVPMLYMGWRVRRLSGSGKFTRGRWIRERLRLEDGCYDRLREIGINPVSQLHIGDDADGRQLGYIVMMLFRDSCYTTADVGDQLNMSAQEVEAVVLDMSRAKAGDLLNCNAATEASIVKSEQALADLLSVVHFKITSRPMLPEEVLTPYYSAGVLGAATDPVAAIKKDIARIARSMGSERVAEEIGATRQQVAAWVAWDTMRERESEFLRDLDIKRDSNVTTRVEHIRALWDSDAHDEARKEFGQLKAYVRQVMKRK